MSTIFFTGFPGFLGRELLPRVLARSTSTRAVCLVQEKFRKVAEDAVASLERADETLRGRIELVAGDLTARDLGLGDRRDAIAREVREIYHLAAVYDLAVPREVGMAINVEGTRHLLDFAKRCDRLERHQYVSTCYVSGKYPGIFREQDLEVGQSFNNYYEETKYLAEVLVRDAAEAGMPTTVYRPAIVVGDSKTGATQKYDGPYFVIRYLLKQPEGFAVAPLAGDPHRTRLNVVPRDYVVDAIAYLSGEAKSLGKTYQLAAPRPATIADLVQRIGEATGRRLVTVRLPPDFARWALSNVKPVRRFLDMPGELVAYFVHPTFYTTHVAEEDLAGTGIAPTPLEDMLPQMVEFVKAHPEISSNAMI
ncbi:MAG: SDR family oxidoreductase [Myxococcales bacterium]|nr:SDR family oxidoreductase [Myxococcales bacterium]